MTFPFNSPIIICIIVPCFNQTRVFSSTNSKGNKKSTLDCKIAELVLHTKTTIFTNNTYNTYYVVCHILISKTTYHLREESY